MLPKHHLLPVPLAKKTPVRPSDATGHKAFPETPGNKFLLLPKVAPGCSSSVVKFLLAVDRDLDLFIPEIYKSQAQRLANK